MILPRTGRGQREALTEGALLRAQRSRPAPSTTRFAGGPTPRLGEDLR